MTNIHTIKQKIQSILGDGLVVIVGCGLSSAEGLPGMYELAKHLMSVIPSSVKDGANAWLEIKKLLDSGLGLEEALAGQDLPNELIDRITIETSRFISNAEKKVISDVLHKNRKLRFSLFIEALSLTQAGISILSTNYDRLIEVACEASGLCIDTMFVGHSVSKFDPRESAYSFCRSIRKRQGKLCLDYAHHIRILKPHGSLDWYSLDGRPVRCPYQVDIPPLILAPGDTKYRAGYKEPFDAHRERANRKIDRGKKYLIIGYGFNDDHLQTHLERNLRDGKTCLVVSRELSPSAMNILENSPLQWHYALI